MKELITNVTTEEKKEIERLIEKLNSLNSLMATLNKNSEYYDFKKNNIDRINNDFMNVNTEIKKWWERIIPKYSLKKRENIRYIIVCNENAIYSIEQNEFSCEKCN